jgi:hypothetical protein
MKLDKSKVKEVVQTVFSVIGSLALAGVVIYFIFNAIFPNINLGGGVSYDSYLSDTSSFAPTVSYDTGEDYVYEESYRKDADDYSASNTESKLKKQGTVNILVDDLDTSYNSVYDILQNYEGQLISNYESGEGNDRAISLTLKVESSKFENIYVELKEVEGEIVYASYSTEDVTMEYTDLESRLNNLEATETQLVKILEDATTVSDTLEVYNELTNIRSQIEVIKGQLKYMDSQVDYSYITVTLGLSESGMDIVDEAWKPLGVVKNAFSALVELGKGIANLVIWILVFSPVVGIVVAIVMLAKQRKSKK